MTTPAIEEFLAEHPMSMSAYKTEFNPYLRDGSGKQTNWHVSLTFPERMTAMSFYLSCHGDERPEVGEVLSSVVEEILSLRKVANERDFIKAFKLPDSDHYDESDASFLFNTAKRREGQLRSVLGPALFTELVDAETRPEKPQLDEVPSPDIPTDEPSERTGGWGDLL